MHGSDLAVVSQPFTTAPRILATHDGQTIRAILAQAVEMGALALTDLPLVVVYLNGEPLARTETLATVVEAGDILNIVVEPQGGGGGGKKDVGQVLFQLAVIVVAAWIGGPQGAAAAFKITGLAATLLNAVAAAAVLTLGQYIGAQLFKPETQGGTNGDRFALQSASNQYRPWSPFPQALGAVIVAPDLAVRTFTRSIGEDTWIYGILGLHDGPCQATDWRIGDTAIESFSAEEVTLVHHHTPGDRTFSLYPYDTFQLDLTEELNLDGVTPVVRAAGSEGETFELDFFLPEGLYFAKDDGRVETIEITITARYRPIDEYGDATGDWADGGSVTRALRTRDPVRITHTITLPLGRYEFEVKRTFGDGTIKRHDKIIFTAIRAIAHREPIRDETLSVTEFRVKASSLNQGTLAPITCRIEPIAEIWDGEGWGAEQATSNPAALTRWLLTGPGAAKPLAPEQADAGLSGWYDICADNDWTAGVYLNEDKSQQDALMLLGAAGRAGLTWPGARIEAACWAERPAPAQLFTGRNLRDRSCRVVFPEVVHGLRVEFANIEERGEADQIIVYADGYGETASDGVVAASRTEALRLEGQCTRRRAYLDGLWELNRRRLQREIQTWTADVEYLNASFGDRVALSWRAVGEGLGEARVRARRYDGALVAGLRLDEPVTMEAGQEYAADLRFDGGVTRGVDLVTIPGTSREVTFATPRAEADCPKAGDLVAWGIAGSVTNDLELVGIDPAENLSARLTARSYVADQLMAAEAAAPEIGDSTLSGARRRTPPTPVLLGVQGAPTGVRVSFSIPPWDGSPITAFSVRWRITPEDPAETGGWVDLPQLSGTGRILITPPPRMLPAAADTGGDATIDVEIITLTAAGQFSSPLYATEIVVTAIPGDPTTNTGARRPTGRSLLYPLSATNSTITVLAHTVYMESGDAIALPAHTITGLDESTLYQVFWRADVGYEVEADPAPDHMAYGNWILVGAQNTSDAEGEYPDTPTPPPGYCPHEDEPILLADATCDGPGKTVRAAELRAGQIVWTRHEITGAWGGWVIEAVEPAESDLLRVLIDDGREVRVSPGHRFGLVDGGYVEVEDLANGQLIDGNLPGAFVQAVPAGRGRVVRISVEGARSFVVGGLLSHNVKWDPTMG